MFDDCPDFLPQNDVLIETSAFRLMDVTMFSLDLGTDICHLSA